MVLGGHPTLPDNATYFYLAEGAANIVYTICASHESGVAEEQEANAPPQENTGLIPGPRLQNFEGKLLRVRKDRPTTVPCAVSHAAWLRIIAPLFRPDQLVEQSLIELRPVGLVERLNAELAHLEKNAPLINSSPRPVSVRPKCRQGVYLAKDEYGLLVTDMTRCSSSVDVVEFKPKWLVQSLSAPAGSKRCRQCAHVARVNARRSRRGEKLSTFFCPLDLVSDLPEDMNRVSSQLLGSTKSPSDIRRFARWLGTDTLLRQLSSYQKTLDQKGVLVGDVDDEDFLTAMTLRDCSIFVKFKSDESGENVEARLGDLDLKSKAKKEYWRNSELELIEEGWYEGREKAEDRQPIVCKLNPERITIEDF